MATIAGDIHGNVVKVQAFLEYDMQRQISTQKCCLFEKGGERRGNDKFRIRTGVLNLGLRNLDGRFLHQQRPVYAGQCSHRYHRRPESRQINCCESTGASGVPP